MGGGHGDKNIPYLQRQRAYAAHHSFFEQLCLALKVGSVPDSPDSHSAIRQWLQARLDEDVDPDRVHRIGTSERPTLLTLSSICICI
jgi:hypothetical protein